MIFLTGMVRSGTSFATGVVSECTGIRLAAQPLPLLYVHVMEEFRKRLKLPSDGFPLSDCILRNSYPHAALVEFLGSFSMSCGALAEMLQVNREYSGQQTRITFDVDLLPESGPSGLATLVSLLLSHAEYEGVRGFGGSKETSCEEFVPYFADQGWFVVHLIRDVREVLCSLNFGKGGEFTGLPKPTLFNLRQWRKSVAFALTQGERENVVVLRYEDLLASPEAAGEGVAHAYCRWRESHGWHNAPQSPSGPMPEIANSSFPAERPSMSRYQAHLDADLLRFVESLCWHEMCAMGYALDSAEPPEIPDPTAFSDPFEGFREQLAHYRWTKEAYEEELRRADLLAHSKIPAGDAGVFVCGSERELLSATHSPGSL